VAATRSGEVILGLCCSAVVLLTRVSQAVWWQRDYRRGSPEKFAWTPDELSLKRGAVLSVALLVTPPNCPCWSSAKRHVQVVWHTLTPGAFARSAHGAWSRSRKVTGMQSFNADRDDRARRCSSVGAQQRADDGAIPTGSRPGRTSEPPATKRKRDRLGPANVAGLKPSGVHDRRRRVGHARRWTRSMSTSGQGRQLFKLNRRREAAGLDAQDRGLHRPAGRLGTRDAGHRPVTPSSSAIRLLPRAWWRTGVRDRKVTGQLALGHQGLKTISSAVVTQSPSSLTVRCSSVSHRPKSSSRSREAGLSLLFVPRQHDGGST